MSESISLVKANPLLPAEDYAGMRSEGFKAIEKTGSSIWTDYNNSDPGITILEAVTYAITDLGYRTGFDIKDLLAPEELTNDTWKQIFYTAREILHNSPLTLIDYRKMIIDIKGVRNAWIEPSKDYEVPLWIDYNYFEQRNDDDCSCKDADLKICKGQLTTNAAIKENVDAYLAKKLKDTQDAIATATTNKTNIDTNIAGINTKIDNEQDPITKQQLKTQLAALQKQQQQIVRQLAELQQVIDTINGTSFIQSKIVELEGLYNVMVEYEEDVLDEDRREEVRLQVIERLSHHRNLCEDFLTINAVEYVDMGLGASIALEEYADPDVVLAQIFFIIYKYFTPSIPFNTMQQMMDKGYSVDEIFEGPALKHGFIDTTDIENTDLFRDIRLSDIISEIVDIKGVIAITYIHLPFNGFDDDTASRQYFDEWVDLLQEERKIARIQPSLSQVIFCKQRDIITYNVGRPNDRVPDRMLKLFNDMKTTERAYKLEGVQLDFKVPAGEFMDLEDYYPVTYSLPLCYGVSDKGGLSSSADVKRKVQALQLKGYLLFFEQLLKDHLVQLNHLKDIFCFDESAKHTYYTTALTEIEDLQSLLIDYGNHGSAHFDKILKDFSSVLQNLTEPAGVFLQRRNHFLNHMLARFSEDLSEYESLTRWLVPGNADERLIQDKINILKDGEYYKISSNRANGYDYTSPDIMDTDNVSGAERRIARLLGFANVNRRLLAPAFIITDPVMEQVAKKPPEQKINSKGQPVTVIKLLDPDDATRILFTSVEVAEGCCTELLMNDIIAHADDRRYFKFYDELNHRARKTAGPLGSFWFELYDGTDTDNAVLLGTSARFDKRENRDKTFKDLEKAITMLNANEGLHLVEHILLRPKLDLELDEANQDIPIDFLQVCLDDCDLGIGLEAITPPAYRKKITRIPAEKCYDKMPWVLEYFRYNSNTSKYDQSIFFQQTFTDDKEAVKLKFRRYTAMTQRIMDLQEFGSERINYEIVSNNAEVAADIRYSFILHGADGKILAQSSYVFNKKTGTAPVTDDIEEEIINLVNYFGFELDLYCNANPCDNNEDPYSFRGTILLPCWPKRLRDANFQNFVQKTISAESPAHVHLRVHWVGIAEMQRFEKAYSDWLLEMAQTELPSYEKVNPLVEVINTIRHCGDCDDDCGN